MDRRKELLLEYLREVVRDLGARGILAKHNGWTLVQYLESQPSAVWGSIIRDFSDAGLSIKNELINGLRQGVMGAIGQIFGNATRRP